MSMPVIIDKNTIVFAPQVSKDSSYGICNTCLEDFITPFGVLIPINSSIFAIKDWLETGYFICHDSSLDSACLLLTRNNRLYTMREDSDRMIPSFLAYFDTIKPQVYHILEVFTFGEHATALNALIQERGLDMDAAVTLAKESFSKMGIPVERLQTFSRLDLVAKVQEMYPNDESGSVGDLPAFVEKSLARHNNRRELLKSRE